MNLRHPPCLPPIYQLPSEIAFHARVVCATNRDLETEVEEGRFRQDLFYRVNVVAIEVSW